MRFQYCRVSLARRRDIQKGRGQCTAFFIIAAAVKLVGSEL